MLQYKWLNVAVAIVTCILQAQCADKYTDENRPYEFGFKIGEEQHRHEKKDENGLIMGEFGFITADGVYHVTVYATDENGNFKILSMKNIRVKPYPSGPEKKPPVSEKRGHSLPFPPSQNPPQTQGPSPQEPSSSLPGPVAAAPTKTCSSCSIPTTTTRRPQLTDLAVVSKDKTSQFGVSAPSSNQNPQGKPNYPGQNANGGPVRSEPQYPQGGSDQNYPQQGAPGQRYPQQGIPGQNYPQQGARPSENYPQAPIAGQQDYAQAGVGTPSDYPQMGSNYPEGVQPPGQTLQTPLGTNGGERSPKQFEYPQQGQAGQENGPQGGNVGGFGPEQNERPNKPTLISAQMQIVDKNTDIHHKNPGEKDGLPGGLTKDDMVRLLYTFNYTVGFHGHFEEGYTNGVKQGYYFVTGRNGVRTRVDYVADENGFRPKITQEVLDLISEDVPKPETEKDEKYGLKGYEFKWLYYPVGSSRR